MKTVTKHIQTTKIILCLTCHRLSNYWLITVTVSCLSLFALRKQTGSNTSKSCSHWTGVCGCVITAETHTQDNKQTSRHPTAGGYTTSTWPEQTFPDESPVCQTELGGFKWSAAAFERHSAARLHTEEERQQRRWSDWIYSSASFW